MRFTGPSTDNRIGSGTMSDERTGQPGACPFFLSLKCQRPEAGWHQKQPPIPVPGRRGHQVRVCTRLQSRQGPLSKPKPRPRRATPRHAERPEGEGGGATGRRRQGRRRRPPRGPTAPEARSEAEGPPGPGAGAAQRAHGPERVGTTDTSRARRSVVLGAETWGGYYDPPQG